MNQKKNDNLSKRYEQQRRESEERRQQILRALADGAKSSAEIANIIGARKSVTNSHLLYLRSMTPKAIHIACWRRNKFGGGLSPVYQLGAESDAPETLRDTDYLHAAPPATVHEFVPPAAANDPLLAWILRRAA